MLRIERSLRLRITLWYSAVLLAGQVAAGVTIWLLLAHSLRSDLDAALLLRTKGLERYLALEASDNRRNLTNEMEEFARSLPGDYVMHVEDAGGKVLAGSGDAGRTLPGSLPPLGTQAAYGRTTSREFSYRTFGETFEENGHSYRVFLAASTRPVENALHLLAFWLIAAIPGVVIIAAAGGYWISRRALSPVDRMTAAARSINFQNLSARLEVPRTSDELQRLAQTWNEMLERIENSAIRVTRFTADASHELRTPLSLIKARTELALRRPRNAEQYREALQAIQAEGERMTRLVEDLLFLARTDSDSGPRYRRQFDLRIAVEAAAFEMMARAADKQVELRINTPDAPVPIVGNEDAVRRLVLVLLDNAVKFSPRQREVTVDLQLRGAEAILEVHDAGVGIPPEAQPLIFERFFRADPARKAETPSYGLGLAIARAVADQHGVTIRADSEPGSTTFLVQFPHHSTITMTPAGGGDA